MITLKPQSSHWYLRDGTPYYEIVGKNGIRRKVTLADGRKVNALPSVTNILSTVAKPGLINWQIEQAILAAETLPRIEGESVDERVGRIVGDMSEESEKAKQLGTTIHDTIAEYVTKRTISLETDLLSLFSPVREWLDQNIVAVHWSEKVLVNTYEGYAGRADLLCELKDIGLALIDFKTQKVKKGRPVFYDEWPLQLAAYSMCGIEPHAALVSVVINVAEPAPPVVRMWDDEGWGTFLDICAVWRYFHDYDPRDCNLLTETLINETETETKGAVTA